jgi:TonB dependent receptor/Carboxypeptidase regulatory-like domain
MLRRRTLALLGLLLVAGETLAAERFVLLRGMPLAQALGQLNEGGMRLVYSSVMVPPTLLLANNARGNDAMALAREILQPHGLRLRPLGAGLFAVVAIHGASSSLAERRISGSVRNSANSEPVHGARVEVAGARYVGWTDSSGAFRATLTGPGPHALRISAVGFETAILPVDAMAAAADGWEVHLNAAEVPLEQVTVVASRYTFDDVEAAFAMDQSAIMTQPKLGEDALQAVARLPGVLFSSYSGRPNVRGGEAGESLIVLDGMPIREPYHLPDYNSAFSALDENLISGLTAYTGLVPTRFGNRLSSVIDLQSVDPHQPALHAVALSSFNARVRTGRGNDSAHGVGWLASARLGTVNQWIEKVAPDLGMPRSRDGFFKLEKILDDGTRLRGQTLLSRSKYDFVDPDLGERAELHSSATYAWTSAQRSAGDSLTLNALLGYSSINSLRSGNVADGLTSSGMLRDQRSARLWDLQFFGHWQPDEQRSLEVGFNLASSRSRYDYASTLRFHPTAMLLFGVPQTQSRRENLLVHRDLLGLYLTDKRRLANRWYLETGLRWDLDFAEGAARRSYVNPRLALRWDPTPLGTLRLSWGHAVQAAEAHELRVEDGERALPAAQRLKQTVLSYEHVLASGWILRVEGFERRVPNPRVRFDNLFDPLRVLPDLSADRVAIAPERARIRGVELSGHWEQGPWSVWGAYTWSKSLDRIQSLWIPREWDQRNTLALALGRKSGPWTASLQGSYHGGRPATPIVDASLLAPMLGVRHSRRMGMHLAIDAFVARRFDFGAGTLVVHAQITNLLNRSNPCCTELDLPDEDSDPTAMEIQPLAGYPLVPAIGVSYEF